jgi:hypothetical protein
MDILLLTIAMPTIMMMMMIAATPQTEGAMIECVVIHPCIIAMSEVYTIVSTAIRVITYRYTEIKVVTVTIS